MKKGIYLLILVCAISLTSAGCGFKPASSGSMQGSNSDISSTVPPSLEKKESGQTQEIQVYFTDEQLTRLEQGLKEINFENESDKYSKTFAAFQSSNQDDWISLWKDIRLLSSSFEQGMLTLDVHIPEEARLGSTGELLALESLEKTFFQFDEVISINLLVDGEVRDSLMGHVDLDHPIKRE